MRGFLLVLLLSQSVWAWKPVTHEALAEIVLRDLLDDGRIGIYLVSGEKIGDFPADPELLEAVWAYPAYFRAGVLGPDAYPDIATGQCVIHPDQAQGGSNAWLEYLWGQARGLPAGAHRQQCLAWTCGFLVHAAGDMYAHSYINEFAGGDFELGQNAIKHIVLEGHVADRTEMNFPFDASIAGIEDFIYNHCINAADNPILREQLLVGPETAKSIPAEFSALRRKLDSDIGEYYRSSRMNPVWAAETTYKEHWRDDIMEGLRAWPGVNHSVACALFFNPGGVQVEQAQQIMEHFAKDHLLSMAGAPDAAGKFLSLTDAVAEVVLPQEALARLKRWKNNLLLEMLQSSTGIDLRMYKAYMTQPESHFDEFLGAGSPGPGRKMNLRDFDSAELGVTGPEPFDYRRFRPAYNTVAMTRLIFLSRESVNGVLAGLGSPARLSRDNVMLGFQRKLDGSRQWDANAEKMVVAGDPVAYRKLFFP
ncbi:MAG: hypothetical protein U0931_37480 [Vulcanimicrobiota bacterium]